jgi:hypothetical protein
MSLSRRDQLKRFADIGYEVPPNWQTEALTTVEAKRLARSAGLARVAIEVPRRLGGDANGYELAADKKLSKRITHVYFTLWTRLVRSPHAPLPLELCPVELVPPRNWKALYTLAVADDDIRRIGTTVLWEDWWNELAPRLHARRMVLATMALKRDEIDWGYRMVVSLTDEINWIGNKFDLYHASLKRRANNDIRQQPLAENISSPTLRQR